MKKVIFIAYIALLFVGPLLAPHAPDQVFQDQLETAPFADYQFPLGTDEIGRDVLSRILYGGRVTVLMSFVATTMAFLVGGLLGGSAGFFGGTWDRLVAGFSDVLLSLPGLLVALVVVALVGPGWFGAVISVFVVGIGPFVKMTRSLVREQRQRDYVAAHLALGARPLRVLWVSIFPNCISPLFVQWTLVLSEGILYVAALGFLGLGVQPPQAEWGAMLADARTYLLSDPHLMWFPGVMILFTVLFLNFIGDEMRLQSK